MIIHSNAVEAAMMLELKKTMQDELQMINGELINLRISADNGANQLSMINSNINGLGSYLMSLENKLDRIATALETQRI